MAFHRRGDLSGYLGLPIGRTPILRNDIYITIQRFAICLLVCGLTLVSCIQVKNLSATPEGGLEQNNQSNNPFTSEYATFMQKFDVPKVHGSGIYVDLGNTKIVNGKSYREAAGRCPVFGKYIQTYQPLNRAGYPNDFLADVPTQAEATKSGNPLPGGFNNLFMRSGGRMSPMDLNTLNSFSTMKATTPLGRCAEYSYATVAKNSDNTVSDYRYPFVWDADNNLCYYLYVSMQYLSGERYCSVNDVPKGLTWYCFEPKKDAKKRNLVYGSSYVGQNPDDWVTKCPAYGVQDAAFGVWEQGRCSDIRSSTTSAHQVVASKEECWALAFSDKSANDAPGQDDANSNTFGYFFPSAAKDAPVSGGVGANYSTFHFASGIRTPTCSVSTQVPSCFIPCQGCVSYTSLSGLQEEPLPSCSPSFAANYGDCDMETCKRNYISCAGNILTSTDVDCEETCATTVSYWMIFIGVVGLLLVFGLIAGLIYYFNSNNKSSRASSSKKASSGGTGGKAGRSRGAREQSAADLEFNEQDQHKIERKHQRVSDFVQAEPSFWDETEIEPHLNSGTDVLLENDY